MEEKTYGGYEPFRLLYTDGEIKAGTKIQLLPGHKNAWEEGMFVVNGQGGLESMAQSEPPYLAEKLLAMDYSPNGWKILED